MHAPCIYSILFSAYIPLLPLRRHAVKTNSFLLTARRNVRHKGLVQRWCIHDSFTHSNSHLPLIYITFSFRLYKQWNWEKLRSSPLPQSCSTHQESRARGARSLCTALPCAIVRTIHARCRAKSHYVILTLHCACVV